MCFKIVTVVSHKCNNIFIRMLQECHHHNHYHTHTHTHRDEHAHHDIPIECCVARLLVLTAGYIVRAPTAIL
jgi:hypothetical protein